MINETNELIFPAGFIADKSTEPSQVSITDDAFDWAEAEVEGNVVAANRNNGAVLADIDLQSQAGIEPLVIDFKHLFKKGFSVIAVQAEYGSQKTRSARLQLGNDAIYVSNRITLNEQEKQAGAFADTKVVNSLHTLVANYKAGYKKLPKYLVIDEVDSTFGQMRWRACPFELIVEAMRWLIKSDVKIALLSRDLPAEMAEAICQVLGVAKSKLYYYSAERQERKQTVFLTRNYNVFMQAMLSPNIPANSIKVILTDRADGRLMQLSSAIRADRPDAKITTIVGGQGELAPEMLKQCVQDELDGYDVWLLGSPVIEQGVSIEGDVFTAIGYLQEGNPGTLRPVSNGLQALHRVRNRAAVRIVCLLEPDRKKNKPLLSALRKQLQQQHSLMLEAKVFDPEGPRNSRLNYKQAYIMFAYVLQNIDAKQRANLFSAYKTELIHSGYTVAELDTELTKPPKQERKTKPDPLPEPEVFTGWAETMTSSLMADIEADPGRLDTLRKRADVAREAEAYNTQWHRAEVAFMLGTQAANDWHIVSELGRDKSKYFAIRRLHNLLSEKVLLKYNFDAEKDVEQQVLTANLLRQLFGTLPKATEMLTEMAERKWPAEIIVDDRQGKDKEHYIKQLNRRLQTYGLKLKKCGKDYSFYRLQIVI